MSTVKLTLTVDPEKIKLAKHFARANDTSVSKMVEHFFSTLSKVKKKRSASFRRLRGVGSRLPTIQDHKNVLSDLLAEKYL